MTEAKWPRIDGHTPHPWSNPEGYEFEVYAGEHALAECSMRPWSPQSDQNSRLMAAAPAGPHLCDVPDCPGPKLVAKLEAAEKMASAFKAYVVWQGPACVCDACSQEECDCEGKPISAAVDAALNAWDAANR